LVFREGHNRAEHSLLDASEQQQFLSKAKHILVCDIHVRTDGHRCLSGTAPNWKDVLPLSGYLNISDDQIAIASTRVLCGVAHPIDASDPVLVGPKHF
jgi:hypothetical protein